MVLQRLFSRRVDSLEIPQPSNYAAGEYEDCTACRVVGSTALVGLGGYTYFTGMKNLNVQRKAIELSRSKYKYGSRQLGIVLLSASLVGMGVYRTFN